MFEELEEKEPEHFAVKQYRKYKLAAGLYRICIIFVDTFQLAFCL